MEKEDKIKDGYFLSSGQYTWTWQEKSWGGFGIDIERGVHVGKVSVKEVFQSDHKTTYFLVQEILLNSLLYFWPFGVLF